MKKSASEIRHPQSFSRNALGVLLGVAVSACQTAPLGDRTPANEAENPRLLRAMQSDAVDALGAYAHLVFLDILRQRAELSTKLVKPQAIREVEFQELKYGVSVGAVASLFSFVGPPASGSSLPAKSVGKDSPLARLLAPSLATERRASVSSAALGGSFALGSLGYMAYTQTPGALNEAGGHPARSLQLILRRPYVEEYYRSWADKTNEHAKAALVAGLKEFVGDLAYRLSKLYAMSDAELAKFEKHVESSLTAALGVDRPWRPNEPVQVDILRALRSVLEYPEERMHATALVLQSVEGAHAAPLDVASPGEIRRWFSDMRGFVEGLAYRARELRERTARVADLDHKFFQPRHESLIRELDALEDRLRLHEKLVPGGRG